MTKKRYEYTNKRTKLRELKEKLINLFPRNIEPCQILEAANFFHLRLHPVRICRSLYGTGEKQREFKHSEKTQNSAEQNLPNWFMIIENKKI